MFIYIDESGSFAYPRPSKHSYARAGALTISEDRHSKVLEHFQALKAEWGRGTGEVKGREVNEAQVSQVLSLLAENGVRFHAVATDMLHNPPGALQQRKGAQARRLLANITDEHHPNLVEELREIESQMRGLPDQLFLQFCLMTELVNIQLRDALIYYALTAPVELGSFHWVVDRKGKNISTYEKIWRDLLPGLIQGRQFSNVPEDKVLCVKEGDYSYCSKFFARVERWPAHLPALSPGLRSRSPVDVVDLGLILWESFTLADSAEREGLQLVDITSNALRRAMTGSLRHEGWSGMGRLMFRFRSECVRLVAFNDLDDPSLFFVDDHCEAVLKEIREQAGLVIPTAK